MQKIFEISLQDLATRLQGECIGNGSFMVKGVCPVDEPRLDAISFIKEGRLNKIDMTKIGALIVSDAIDKASLEAGGNFISVPHPYEALVSILPLFFEYIIPERSLSPKSDIASTAKIGEQVHVGAFSVIGDRCEIGDNCTIHPHVVLYPKVKLGAGTIVHSGAVIREGSIIGRDSVIQSGAVIGGDGFGYVPDIHLGLRAIPQVGIVEIGDRVDVGANSCIDRATLGTTKIGMSSKIDNLVQVGHNTKIGIASILCGQVGVAGSATIGNQVVLAGSVGVADHINITDGVRVSAKAVVTESLNQKGDYGGVPAIPISTHRRNQVALRSLADFVKEVRKKLASKE